MTADAGTGAGAGVLMLFLVGLLVVGGFMVIGNLPAIQAINAPSQAAQELSAVQMTLPEVGEVTLSTHATDKHGWEAVQARALAGFAEPPNIFNCNDGRTRFVVPDGDGEWGIVVIEAAKEITAFMTDDVEYVAKVVMKCGVPPSRLDGIGLTLASP